MKCCFAVLNVKESEVSKEKQMKIVRTIAAIGLVSFAIPFQPEAPSSVLSAPSEQASIQTPTQRPALPTVIPESQIDEVEHVKLNQARLDLASQILFYLHKDLNDTLNNVQASHQRVKVNTDQEGRQCRLWTHSLKQAQINKDIHASSHIDFDESSFRRGHTEITIRVPRGKMERWRSDIERGIEGALLFFQTELKLTVDSELYVDLTILENKNDYVDFAQKFEADELEAKRTSGMFFWGNNQILVDGSKTKSIAYIVAHEMAHKLQQQLIGVMIPLISEGTAEVVEASMGSKMTRRLPNFLDYYGLIYADREQWYGSSDSGKNYALASLFMHYLINTHRDRALKLFAALAEKPCEHLSIEEFEAIISPDDQFEADFTRFYSEQFYEQQQQRKKQ